MAAPQFTLKIGDGLGAHIGAEEELFAGAQVTFTPNIKTGDLVPIDGNLRIVDPVIVTLDDDGKLNGNTGIQLLADDASLGLDNTLQWKVTVKKAKARGFSRSVREWWIDAGAPGSTVDLSTVPPAVGTTATGSRGLPGATTIWVEVEAGPPRLWQQQNTETGVYIGEPVDYLPDVTAEVSSEVAAEVAAQVPEAVDADLATRVALPHERVTDSDTKYAVTFTDNEDRVLLGITPDRGEVVVPRAEILEELTLAGAVTEAHTNTDYLKGSSDASGNAFEDVLDLNGKVPAWVLSAWAGRMGLLEPALPFDIVIVAGQSNATERTSLTAVVTDPDPRMKQWDPNANAIAAATTQGTGTNQTSWLGNEFAREYLKNTPGRRVLIVPCALGSTGFTTTSVNPPASGYQYVSGGGTWDRNLVADPVNLYSRMIARATAARTAAGSGARIVAVLWSQGESDRATMNQTQYAAALDDLIAQTRTDLAISDLPFIIGSMTPEVIEANETGTAGINLALLDTPRRVVRTSYVWGPKDLVEYNQFLLHWSPQGQMVRGRKMATEGLLRARLNTTTEKPICPQGLKIERSGTNARIVWEPPPCRHTAFTLQTSVNEGSNWTTQTLASPIITEHTLTGLTATTPLWARMTTTNNVGTSDYSRTVKA